MAPSIVLHAHIILFVLDRIDEKLSAAGSTFAEKAHSKTFHDHFLNKFTYTSGIDYPVLGWGQSKYTPYQLPWLRDCLVEAIRHDSTWTSGETTDEDCIGELFSRGTMSLNPKHVVRLQSAAAKKKPRKLKAEVPEFADTPDVTPEKPINTGHHTIADLKSVKDDEAASGEDGAEKDDGHDEVQSEDEVETKGLLRLKARPKVDAIKTSHRGKITTSNASRAVGVPITIDSDHEDDSEGGSSHRSASRPKPTTRNSSIATSEGEPLTKSLGAPPQKRKAEVLDHAEIEEPGASRQVWPKRSRHDKAQVILDRVLDLVEDASLPSTLTARKGRKDSQDVIDNGVSQQSSGRVTRSKTEKQKNLAPPVPAPPPPVKARVTTGAPPPGMPGDDDDDDDSDGNDSGGKGRDNHGDDSPMRQPSPVSEQSVGTAVPRGDILSLGLSDVIPYIHAQISAATNAFFIETANLSQMCHPDLDAPLPLRRLYIDILCQDGDEDWKSTVLRLQSQGLFEKKPFFKALIWAYLRLHIFSKPDIKWDTPHDINALHWAPYLRAALRQQEVRSEGGASGDVDFERPELGSLGLGHSEFQRIIREASFLQLRDPEFKAEVLNPKASVAADVMRLVLAGHIETQDPRHLPRNLITQLTKDLRAICQDALLLHARFKVELESRTCVPTHYRDRPYHDVRMAPDESSMHDGDRIEFATRPALIERRGTMTAVLSKALVIRCPRDEEIEHQFRTEGSEDEEGMFGRAIRPAVTDHRGPTADCAGIEPWIPNDGSLAAPGAKRASKKPVTHAQPEVRLEKGPIGGEESSNKRAGSRLEADNTKRIRREDSRELMPPPPLPLKAAANAIQKASPTNPGINAKGVAPPRKAGANASQTSARSTETDAEQESASGVSDGVTAGESSAKERSRAADATRAKANKSKAAIATAAAASDLAVWTSLFPKPKEPKQSKVVVRKESKVAAGRVSKTEKKSKGKGRKAVEKPNRLEDDEIYDGSQSEESDIDEEDAVPQEKEIAGTEIEQAGAGGVDSSELSDLPDELA